jgi:nucleoside-diphosphate-sugar epimerase
MEPPTVYGSAKVAAELVGRSAAAEIGIPFITLRLFNVYGPGENSFRLIPHVVDAVIHGTVADLTSGEQVRDFVFVDDVARAFEACGVLANPVSASFNVATGVGTPVSDVALKAAQAAGGGPRSLGFGARPSRRDEPARVVGNASALAEATGWNPQTSVADGVERTVRWILNAGAGDA